MKNVDNQNEFDDLYQTRKQQFRAPNSSKFKQKKPTVFWKSISFYSSLCAFSLALIVVIPAMNIQKQSDLIIESSVQSAQDMPQQLDEVESFSAQPMMIAPMADQLSTQKESQAVKMKNSQRLEMSAKKKLDLCERKKILAAQRDANTNNISEKTPTTDVDIDCP